MTLALVSHRRLPLRNLRRDTRAVSIIEFALSLPLFLGFGLTAMEFSNYVLANNRTQRLASMATDLVAQSGAGAIGASEGQIYDVFSALDVTAVPYDMRGKGRIVITSVKGTDNDNNGTIENRIIWQRFDGALVSALPVVGCNRNTNFATLPNSRILPLDEMMFHVQVTYEYQPIMSRRPYSMLSIPTTITRTAMFRARSKDFETPTPDARFPPKSNCSTANGL